MARDTLQDECVMAARAYASRLMLPDPRAKYTSHRARAKKRGIEFKLSFVEWWFLWKDKYHLMGCRKNDYVMCRNLDQGAYEVGNVRIDYASSNSHEKKISNRARHGCRFPAQGNMKRFDTASDFWEHNA